MQKKTQGIFCGLSDKSQKSWQSGQLSVADTEKKKQRKCKRSANRLAK